MKKLLVILMLVFFGINACSESDDSNINSQVSPTLLFTHNWDGDPVSNSTFNVLNYTNENGDLLSIERLRYIISNITFTSSSNESLVVSGYNLVDVTNADNLSFTSTTQIPSGSYNVSFTFGLDNEANALNYIDLNSASFNVPDNLGGGYHYMQLDGKFINNNAEEQGYNYHAIRAVDNPGPNPTFPQDTFFTVNLGVIQITNSTEIEIQMNIAEWFKDPNLWDLNAYNQVLMPNSAAQIMMYENGQTVFSLGNITN